MTSNRRRPQRTESAALKVPIAEDSLPGSRPHLGCIDDDDGDGGAATGGIVGDTDWRERAARARREQRRRVASARRRGEPQSM